MLKKYYNGSIIHRGGQMMKFFWRMMFFILVGLILTMGGISAAMAQSEAPQVTLSFNKESVNVGEEVTASYEVVGGVESIRIFI